MKKKGKYSADDAAAMGGDAAASDTDCHDVFLSFSGVGVGYFFAESLYWSSVDAGIRVFRNADEFGLGEEIGQEILRAIDGAKICIPIFSKYYAYSAGCLRELAAMVESKAKSGGGKTIFPIFYDVEPRDVRLETPLYRDALSMLEKRYGSKEVSAWEDALKQVASLPGWEMRFMR
ncbi:disease resistance protein L6-like [Syzygium oleosum]|uniref:disease resistance protein L6-like n=1 Tax=Syzygium oleosum TaxID=219896 RepID=UPI0024BA814C|nr:disease resistance protein L6-like [Syzygium oleosum]